MNILTSETANIIYAVALMIIIFTMIAINLWDDHKERKHRKYGREYQETNYCNSFNKQFKKPDYSFNGRW